MTIDEAINENLETAKNIREFANALSDNSEMDKERFFKRAKEHEQLAEWLKELKNYRLRFGEKNCSKCKHHAESAFAYPCAECAYSHDVLFEEKENDK